MTFFISVCYSGGVSFKQSEEKSGFRGSGACCPGKFLKFYMVQRPF